MVRRLLFAVLFLISPAFAGPLNRDLVPPDAQWLVHVDVEGAVDSTLGRWMHEHRADVLRGIEDARVLTGIDPTRDLKSFTVYGSSPAPADCIAVIRTTAAIDGLIAEMSAGTEPAAGSPQPGKTQSLAKRIGALPHLTKVDEGGVPLYTWTEHGLTRYAHIEPAGDGGGDRLVLAAPDKVRLLEAVARLKAPAPAGERVLASAPQTGSILFVASKCTGLSNEQCSLLLQKADAFVLDAGESSGEVYANMTVTAASTEDAANMLQAMQGGLALARMCAQSDPELGALCKLGDSLKMAASERTVTATLRCPASKLEKFLNEANEPRPAPPAAAESPKSP